MLGNQGDQELEREVAGQDQIVEQFNHGEPAVQLSGGKGGSPGRAGNPHIPFHNNFFLLQQLYQLAQLRCLGPFRIILLTRFTNPGRQLEDLSDAGVRQRLCPLYALPQAKQVPHQPAPGVAHQVEPCPVRQLLCQGQGIGDGAFGQGVVFPGIGMAITAAKLSTRIGAGDVFPIPEPHEASLEAGHGAVEEQEDRPIC